MTGKSAQTGPRKQPGPDMTMLDVVYHFPKTEAVFKRYEEKTGVCLLCEALFDKVADVADRYQLNLANLMDELRTAAGVEPEAGSK